ncbi:hypothetical protein A0H81_13272 [Grifola frondosa]|uniref:DUF6534 domain-containing protein n=1 Tax=Grifola frondosa TaxID=5627 RepID=A0A1C7LQ11_GRIFR|nr:hypothetical protein A0H81_13272 [Grifola frondosa]
MAGTTFDHTIGSVFIGVLFSTIFYACTCAQCIYYARNYPNDRLFVKALVVFLWTLDTAILILDAISLYRYVVEWHANPLRFFPSRCMDRIRRAVLFHTQDLGPYPLTIAGFAIAIVSLAGGGVVVHVIVANKEDVLTALKAAEKPKIIQCVTTVLADLYIVVLLCLTLKGSSSGGFKRTNRLINKLIVYTVNRGTLNVCSITICSFLTYVAKINEMDLLWVIFWDLGGKAYVNSLLAVYELSIFDTSSVLKHLTA